MKDISPNRELASLFRKCMDRCLPFWYRHGVDHTYGGFFGNVEIDGSLVNDEKGGWYQAFGIWLFAYVYNMDSGEENYLEAAKRGWEFMCRHGRDPDGNWVMSLTRTGDVVEGPTSVLTDAYMAYGLVQLFHATGDDFYLDIARDALLNVEARSRQSEFSATTPSYTEPHSLNGAWGNILPAVTDYLQVRPDDQGINRIVDLCLESVMEKHLDPDTGLIIEVVAPDGSDYTGHQRNHIKPGAAAETCTAMMIEADRRNDPSLSNQAIELLHLHFNAGWDQEYGGIFYEIDRDGVPVEDRKDAWAQAEFMRGLVLAGMKEPANWINDAYDQVQTWAFRTYANEIDDIWRISAHRSGDLMDNTRVDMFHHPRMLLTILKSIEHLN